MAKPVQKRALATREKILDGIEELLVESEFEAITIAQLAKTAGVAVGSVYSHFKDKEALLPALLDRQVERVEARMQELREHGTFEGEAIVTPESSVTLRETIERSVLGAFQQVTQSLGLRRALHTYRRLNPDAEMPRILQMRDEAFELLVQQLELFRDEIRHDDIREAAKMVNYFISILFLDRVVFIKSPMGEDMRPSDETLIANYTDMICHYLIGE